MTSRMSILSILKRKIKDVKLNETRKLQTLEMLDAGKNKEIL